MIGWLHITLIAAFSALILLLLFLLIFQRSLHPKTRSQCINQVNPIFNLGTESSRNINYNDSPYFSWADHPSLVADAVENGWPGFCFESSSDHDEMNVEISWEGSSSGYYMQKVRVKKLVNSSESSLCVIRTALPLPGPRFGNSFFPQQPYFEITILSSSELCENESILMTVGLTAGGHLPLKFPGRFPGSIGFNSSGSVYFNGRKLVVECEKEEWGRVENVIGCGYNPGQNRVFFTLNSQLVHLIHCKTQEFGHPLFPTIAANTGDVTLILNLGQKPFKFKAGNSQRTPNPCLIRPPQEEYPSIGFEDSAELFSLGRMDSLWQHWAAITNNNTNNYKAVELELELEFDPDSDLFEINIGHA